MRKRFFMVGRRVSRTVTLVLVRLQESPLAGPWTLRAMISEN